MTNVVHPMINPIFFFWTFFFHTPSTWWLDGLWGLWHWVYHISLIYRPQSIDFPSFCARMTSVDKGLGWNFAAFFFRLFVGTSWSPIFWTVDRHTNRGRMGRWNGDSNPKCRCTTFKLPRALVEDVQGGWRVYEEREMLQMLRMRKDLLGLRIARLLLFDYLQDSISSFTLLDYTARQCC